MDRSKARSAIRDAWIASLGYAGVATTLDLAAYWLGLSPDGQGQLASFLYGLALVALGCGIHARSFASAGLLLVYVSISTCVTPVWWVFAARIPDLAMPSALWTLQAAAGVVLAVPLAGAARTILLLERVAVVRA